MINKENQLDDDDESDKTIILESVSEKGIC